MFWFSLYVAFKLLTYYIQEKYSQLFKSWNRLQIHVDYNKEFSKIE